MLDVEVLPKDEFDESYYWYRGRSHDAAERFAVPIDNAIQKLRRDPDLGIRIDDEHRIYRLKKSFPFHLVFRVKLRTLVVVTVAHNRRSPEYWRGR